MNHRCKIIEGQRILILEIDTTLTCLDLRIFCFEGVDVRGTAGIERDIVFLIGQRNPTLTQSIGWHLIVHVNDQIRILIHYHLMKKHKTLFTLLRQIGNVTIDSFDHLVTEVLERVSLKHPGYQ
ncbi:MAG: hypothetical protein JAZ20_16215 [Candidatus Thiodiazotropha weberae]|nr:hypothetical protein [Candidatus Thiodiazotropha lotti]MCG8012211.1 hypothetical protein [Candidatus Thiodiazotropha lotti]MCG8021948.1 hypothetical protein [Candidatus Thiodiazotropha lotti]MCW4209120.1 hypothetical protein [Candidatus Thiodiazotropha lotti]MCW4211681.1 hypothetical protein [Candidatus Thiodiazotropha lotti]